MSKGFTLLDVEGDLGDHLDDTNDEGDVWTGKA